LEAQLAAMESKVLQGEAQGGLSELARRQEEVLRSQQQQLQRQRSKDAAKLRQIADMEEAALMAQGKYSSLQARACCLLALLLPFDLPTHSLLLPFGLPTHPLLLPFGMPAHSMLLAKRSLRAAKGCNRQCIQNLWPFCHQADLEANADDMKDNVPMAHGKYSCLQALVLLPCCHFAMTAPLLPFH